LSLDDKCLEHHYLLKKYQNLEKVKKYPIEKMALVLQVKLEN